MSTLIVEQMSVSTAEDENNYFTGQPEALVGPRPSKILPPGNYRVIEGKLFRVVDSVPLTIPGTNMRIAAGSN